MRVLRPSTGYIWKLLVFVIVYVCTPTPGLIQNFYICMCVLKIFKGLRFIIQRLEYILFFKYRVFFLLEMEDLSPLNKERTHYSVNMCFRSAVRHHTFYARLSSPKSPFLCGSKSKPKVSLYKIWKAEGSGTHYAPRSHLVRGGVTQIQRYQQVPAGPHSPHLHLQLSGPC